MKEMAVGQLVDDTTEALQDWPLRPGVRYRYLLEFRIFRHHYGTTTTVFPEMFQQYVQESGAEPLAKLYSGHHCRRHVFFELPRRTPKSA